MPGRDRRLDALRGLAALSIAVLHTLGIAGGSFPEFASDTVSTVLEVGLALFFVLSGYLIGGPFVRSLVDGARAPALPTYALRRALRIMPGYVVALGVAAVAFAAVGAMPGPAGTGFGGPAPSASDLLSAAAMAAYWIPFDRGALLLPPTRTLSLEVAFYIAVPVIALSLLRRRRPVDPAAVLVALLAGWAGSALLYELYLSRTIALGLSPAPAFAVAAHLGFLGLFVPGMLVALLSTRAARRRWPRSIGALTSPAARSLVPFAALVGVAATVAAHQHADTAGSAVDELRRQTGAVASAALLAGALCAPVTPLVRGAVAVLAPLGTISFGIYLYHWVVIEVALRTGIYPLPLPASAGLLVAPAKVAVMLAATLPLATVSWFAVERPAQRLSHRLRSRGWAVVPAMRVAPPG